jgi:hypothetical protein
MLKTLIAFAAFMLCAVPAVAGPDEDAVRHLLHTTFDKPESRLVVDPIAVAGEHSVAGWTQGDMGGRALLRRKGHEWQLVLCSGDQLKSAETLAKVGLSADAAKTLSAQLAEAESKLSPARLALFSKFDGIVMMDAAGHHPPSHAPHHK